MNPIWICGHRKCGTTLLSNLLDGHSEVINYGTDFKLIYAFYNGFDSSRGESFSLSRFKKIFEDDRYGEIIDWNFVKSVVNELDFTTRDCVWQYLIKLQKLTTDAFPGKRLLIKETSSELYRKSISSYISPSYLYCVRDPRDNWAAIKAGVDSYYSKLGEDSLKALASMINRVNLGFNAYKRSIEHTDVRKNWMEVRFEDLTQSTQETMKRISEYLKIEYCDSLMRPTKENITYLGNSHDKNKFTSVSSSNVGRFSERAEEWEIAVIEALCLDVMRYFGYSCVTSQSDREAALEKFYVFYNHEYFYYDKFDLIKYE